MEKESNLQPPHVLVFPFPSQGHIKPMLKLAELLCLAGIHITFLNTHHNHHRLNRFTDIQSRFSKYPGSHFRSVPDGLPPDHPRSGGRLLHKSQEMEATMKPLLTEILLETTFTCIIGDVWFVVDVGVEVGIPVVLFRSVSASSFWLNFCIPDVIDAGELPIGEEEGDMDRLITKVPCMETFLRCRDLPSFCRGKEMADNPTLRIISNITRKSTKSHGLILNTFNELEAPALSHIRTHLPRTYTIGPLHEHLKTKITSNPQDPDKFSVNLWEENRSCLTWLDDQPPQSVLYVSFGSVTVMTTEQIMEFWHGLLISKKKFFWVLRPGLVQEGGEKIPEELVKGVREKDYMVMVGWAPQEEVLAHEAVGGFLTHGGWNSVLESVVAGVPMICWPYFADQQVNSRFVGEVWKVGLDMKDLCDRSVVGKMVNDVMVERREELVGSMGRMSELGKKSVSEGGSSRCDLESLIEDIKLMNNKIIS